MKQHGLSSVGFQLHCMNDQCKFQVKDFGNTSKRLKYSEDQKKQLEGKTEVNLS